MRKILNKISEIKKKNQIFNMLINIFLIKHKGNNYVTNDQFDLLNKKIK